MRYFLFVLLGISFLFNIFASAFESDFPYDDVNPDQPSTISETLKDTNVTQGDSLLNKQSESVYGPNVSTLGEDRGTGYIKRIIDWMLGLAAFISLMFIIYGFVNMIFGGDKEAPKKIMINSFIALALIGLSYFIISFGFWIFGQVASNVSF